MGDCVWNWPHLLRYEMKWSVQWLYANSPMEYKERRQPLKYSAVLAHTCVVLMRRFFLLSKFTCLPIIFYCKLSLLPSSAPVIGSDFVLDFVRAAIFFATAASMAVRLTLAEPSPSSTGAISSIFEIYSH